MDHRELLLAGMDWPDLMQRLMNNEGLVPLFVRKFLADSTYDQLVAAIAAGDMKQAELACHSLKGVCGNLSLKELFGLFQDQLHLFRAGESAQAISMMDEIVTAYEKATSHMRLWLSNQ